MPGLLDFLDDPQTMGLLSTGTAMMNAAGPSLMPHSFGQTLNAGLQGLQQARAQQLATEQARQMAQLRGVQIKDAESDLKNQDMLRERQRKIQEELLGLGAAGAGAPQAAAPQAMASAAPGIGPLSPKVGGPDWMQAYQAQQQTPPMPTPGAAPDMTQRSGIAAATAARLIHEAEVFAKYGDFDGANKRYDAATKLMPKFDTKPQVVRGPDGNPMLIQTADDGTARPISGGYGPAEKLDFRDLGGTVAGLDPYSGKQLTSFKKGQSPDSVASNGLGWARLNWDKSQGEGGGTGPITPAAIDNAAARYNFDGTLPPMGMGKAAAAGRSAILNRAAELSTGVAGTDQRRAQLGNRNDVAAQGTALKSFATGKDGQAVQSANTALNHLDTVLQLAQAQKNGDVQLFNRAARALGTQFGQAAPTNLNAALVMVGPEISKAVIGAGGTGHERDQAQAALNPNGSPDQIIGGAQTMQELFGGRLTEAERTYKRTTMRSDFRDAMLSPAAQRVLAARSSGGGNDQGAPGTFSVTAPNGKTYTFGDAKSLANFKLSAGIR